MSLMNYSNKNSFLNFFDDDFDLMTPKGFHDIPVNIKDRDKSFVLEAYLPGIKKEDLSISLKNDYLTISYENKENKEEKTDKFLRIERRDLSFSRSFKLSPNINQSKITSELKDGVLKIELPKNDEVIEKAQEKKIAIN